MAYSVDLRMRVVRAFEAREGSYDELARRFAVGRATVNRWLRLKRETGDIRRRPRGGGHPFLLGEEHLRMFRAIVMAKPDGSRAELAKLLLARTGISVSLATLGRSLHRLGFTRKKRRYMLRKETPTAS
jgi:transposase